MALPPASYLAMLGLMADAAVVLTDSGGVQEETTALGVPCLTLRENTERPITINEGTNTLVGTDPVAVRDGLRRGDGPMAASAAAFPNIGMVMRPQRIAAALKERL